MSAFEKISQDEMLDYHPATPIHDGNTYNTYVQVPYGPHGLYHPGLNSNVQDTDFQYIPHDHYAQSPAFPQNRPPHTQPRTRQSSNSESFQVNSQHVIKQEFVQQVPRKRKASPSLSEYDVAPPQKKQAPAQVQVQDPNGDYYDFSGNTSPYSPYIPTPTATTGLHATPVPAASPREIGHHYSTSTASQVSLAAPSPHTPAWSPSFTTVKTEPSPRAPMTPLPRPASTSSPLKSSVPKLVRTSTIQQSPAAMSVAMNTIQAQNFNPYAMYPLKANLKLKGDLDSMTKDWNPEELDARRRLVEFKRSQSGSTINADFKPVAPQDRAPSSITISCILWAEKNEHYVTSVDTIYLLEALVGVRFTVEEKNRIRRNLEGFRPATVSKSKVDSEEFFKVIMGFPHPKPRNIEKDVKVFPWKILAHALKKIISKYSASYSSTASALLTPAGSVFANGDSSAEYAYPPSPHPEFAAQPGSYAIVPGPGYTPQQLSGRATAPVTTAPLPDLQVQVPTLMPAYDMSDPYGLATMPGMPHASMPMMPPQAMSAPPSRMPTSWEYANFVQEQPGMMIPNSAPPVIYHRGSVETAEFVTPSHYHMR